MQDSDSSAERIERKKAEGVVRGSLWTFPGADLSVAHHALLLEYVFGCDFVRKRPSNYFNPMVVYLFGKFSYAEGGDPARYRVQSHRGNCKDVRHSVS